MHTEADFSRMREKIAAGAQPWVAGWNALTSSGRASVGATPNPLETVVRGGDGENFRTMVEDLERAYQFAVHWKVSGDTAYADRAVLFLNAWSSTMKALNGNADRFLAAGIYGYQWANAAEIMRSYSGWLPEDLARFQNLMLEVFYPLSHSFLIDHNGSNITNYWANWDLCAICCDPCRSACCAIAATSTTRRSRYYKSGRGNGAAAHNVYFLHPGHLGQWQESGRDQGHATLGMALTGLLCEMAWNQGEDLYGYANNRFLAGAEYVAKSNLQDASAEYYTLPFSTYVNRQGTFTALSTAGRPNFRPCWEVIYNHYVNRKGLSAPYRDRDRRAAAARARRMGRRPAELRHADLQPRPRRRRHAAERPDGLPRAAGRCCCRGGAAPTRRATRSSAARRPAARSPASPSVTDPRTYTDAPGEGVWFYVVSAIDTSGESAASNVVRVALPGELRVQLPLDASSGTDGRSMPAAMAATAR